MEERFDNQRLPVRLSAARIGNKSSNRKIAQTNGCLLINAECRRYGTAGTANGANIVLLQCVISCSHDGGCGREKEKNRCRCHVTLKQVLL